MKKFITRLSLLSACLLLFVSFIVQEIPCDDPDLGGPYDCDAPLDDILLLLTLGLTFIALKIYRGSKLIASLLAFLLV
jgi:hypothetical protein